MVAQRKKQLVIANQLEDKNIKKIEKQLKINKRKSKAIPKSFVDDGLDFLLEVCDPEKRRKLTNEEFDFADNDIGFQEDLALLNQNEEQSDDSPKNNVKGQVLKAAKNRECCYDEASNEGDSSATGDQSETSTSDQENEDKKTTKLPRNFDDFGCNQQEYKEDIYGRLRDKKGNIVKDHRNQSSDKYIPPGKRLSDSTESAADLGKLKRQLKGLFNRLAETNLPGILSSVEKLYLHHSRHNMQEAINTIVVESLVVNVLSPERLIIEHCVLIAALHSNVGTEVGAQFLELVVQKFDEIYQSSDHSDITKKESDNLLLIIAHLYNFGLVAASLVKDILLMLAEHFHDKDVELILLILRVVGFSLRKDDPALLKEVIVTLQTKAAQSTVQPARTRFMLEIVLALRNNNLSKIPNYDPSLTENYKKLSRSLTKKGEAFCRLNISYRELLAAEKRGRWWVVGSAWAGQGPHEDSSLSVQPSKEHQYSASLMEMARKQRMNTEVRRNIFCILMTAEDFIEAFERLLRMELKGQQEREIIHVIIDCCIQEKTYNPYYAYLLQKFCHYHRRFQIASQFAFWDHFKGLKSLSQTQIGHMSKLLVHLILESSLCLSILKVIEFTEIDRLSVRFLRQILLGKYSVSFKFWHVFQIVEFFIFY